MVLYLISMIGTAVFAITGVLALRRDGIDVFGALVALVGTAPGGPSAARSAARSGAC